MYKYNYSLFDEGDLEKTFNSIFSKPDLFQLSKLPEKKEYSYVEEDGKCILELLMPGYEKDEFEIEIVDGVLFIKAEIKDEKKKKSSSLKFSLRKDIADTVPDVSLKNGILRLEFTPVVKKTVITIP